MEEQQYSLYFKHFLLFLSSTVGSYSNIIQEAVRCMVAAEQLQDIREI